MQEELGDVSERQPVAFVMHAVGLFAAGMLLYLWVAIEVTDDVTPDAVTLGIIFLVSNVFTLPWGAAADRAGWNEGFSAWCRAYYRTFRSLLVKPEVPPDTLRAAAVLLTAVVNNPQIDREMLMMAMGGAGCDSQQFRELELLLKKRRYLEPVEGFIVHPAVALKLTS